MASEAATLYGSGVSLDLGPLLVPLAVCLDIVVSSSATVAGTPPRSASRRDQQAGQAVFFRIDEPDDLVAPGLGRRRRDEQRRAEGGAGDLSGQRGPRA